MTALMAMVYNNHLKTVVAAGGGGGGSPGVSGAYNDLQYLSSSTWHDSGTNGADGLVQGSGATSGTDAYGPYTTTTSTSYINNGINLSSPFTISLIASLNPSTYWASLWGCDTYNSVGNGGWYAYMSASNQLNFGSAGATGSIITADPGDVTGRNLWTFVWDGSTATMYKNSTQLATGSVSNPTGSHPNNTNWGARHTNAGASYLDACPGTYRRLLRWNNALSSSQVTTNYNAFKSNYGLP